MWLGDVAPQRGARLVDFTRAPRRVGSTGPSDKGEVLEVRGCRSLELTLRVLGFDGGSSPLLWVAMETSLYPTRDYGSLGRFSTLAGKGEVQTLVFDYVMRYVRWNVVRLDGADAAWFTLAGLARE